MKKNLLWLSAVVAMISSSCNTELESGKGRFSLTLDKAGFFETTKTVNEAAYQSTDGYDVVVTNANGKEVMRCKGADLAGTPSKELEMGSYDIVAYYGVDSDASRDNFYVEGSKSIVLKPNDVVPISLVCRPVCGKISVAFSSEMSTYYSDYYISFGGTKALGSKVITYAKNDSEPWYVKVDQDGEEVSYTLFLTAKDEYMHRDADGQTKKTAQVSGKFNLLRNKAHKLSVKPNYTPQTDGGMGLTITIDDSTVERPIDIEVPVSWI